MTKSISDSIKSYINKTASSMMLSDTDILAEIVERLMILRAGGGVLYTAGNGGSAATASHMANDMTKGTRAHGRLGIRTICLNDAYAVQTCLANDFSYEDALSIALETLGRKDDVLFVYSGSGNSENIIRCVKTAHELGMYVISFTGRDGGKIRAMSDICAIAPSEIMETIEDIHMMWEHAIACELRKRFEMIWDIEKLRPFTQKPKAALFDFDGTVSLIRQGWQEIMIPYFIEILTETPAYILACAAGREKEELNNIKNTVTDFVDILTGKQTIFQCEKLNEEVIARGGEAVDPYLYKKEYLRRLLERIAYRREGLRIGDIRPERMIVEGFVSCVNKLHEKGIKVYLASGTDEADVMTEAALLGVSDLFDGGIYGARDEIKDCSKELVIRRIIEENGISGEDIISFGDGYVEIELIAELGGYAVGVATDEEFLIEKAYGKKSIDDHSVNLWKRGRLTAAGASAIIPDFTGFDLEKLI